MAMKYLFGIIMLMCISISMAATTEIALKTNEEYTAKYTIRNTGDDALSDCKARWQLDFAGKDWVQVYPIKFDMAPGKLQELSVVISKPPAGYYSDVLQVSCKRSLNGIYVGTYDIIAPQTEPVYSLNVKIAGEGEGFTVQPKGEFNFLTNPGDVESAKFTIVNTGTVDLPVKIASDDPNLLFVPNDTVIGINNRLDIQIVYKTQANFQPFKKSIIMKIGSYDEPFIISGQLESEAAGAPALATIVTGETKLGNTVIPAWVVWGALIVALVLIIRENKK